MFTSKVANTDDGSFRTIANFAIRFRSLKNMPSGWTITPCTPSRIDENELAAPRRLVGTCHGWPTMRTGQCSMGTWILRDAYIAHH